MFNAYEFTFDGVSSELYGLHLYDFGGQGQKPVSFGNKAEIIETNLNSRIRPIHYGVNYHASPLEFTMVFGSVDKTLDRYEMEDIAMWLTGPGKDGSDYHWLTIGQRDLEHCRFRCIITQLTPIHDGWLPYAFEATVRCDCPYAYGYPFSETFTVPNDKNTLDCVFHNDGSCREYLRPVLEIKTGTRKGNVSVENKNDGNRRFEITEVPANTEFTVDCETGIILEKNGTNLYRNFNMVFPRFIHGSNNLVITGASGTTVTIRGAFLYNVAG